VTARSLRFTAEADSLNCSVLGPDAGPGTPEFDLYIDALVTEMTAKAGQKCTAIRRAFVPRHQIEAVTQATRERLAGIVVGAPGADGVGMGSLAGLAQRDEVRGQVARLREQARLVFGDPEKVEVAGADPVRGAFLSPLLLRADDAHASAPHQIEAFGPVSTLLPYESTAELVELVALGEGSLAGSVVTHDPQFARDLVLGIAPLHGRVLVLNRDDSRESTGHGIPMPQLVHGGPGRAGGGEEEGGLRAVWHHMQRTAVQGSPAMLAAILEKNTTR
jgi:oxepin-CoA hydrolase/3-oxo-5,6-dehydrosuberyl-CoA semialdehyde dehydrogenase